MSDHLVTMTALDFHGYMEDIRQDERERILQGLQDIEDQAHKTRTPLFQDTLFKKVRELIDGKSN